MELPKKISGEKIANTALHRDAGTSKGQGGAAFSWGTFNTVGAFITTNIAEILSNN